MFFCLGDTSASGFTGTTVLWYSFFNRRRIEIFPAEGPKMIFGNLDIPQNL